MRASDIAAIVSSTLFGALTGWLIDDTKGAVVAGIVFGSLAFLGARANVRPAIVATVLVGTMAGGLIGSSIVEAICLPATCPGLEATGGIVTAALTFVGVGLVAALVTRSFDEYNERDGAGLPEITVGCELDEDDPQT